MSEQSVNIDLGRLENRVEQLARIQDQTNEKLDGMGREITQVQKNLSELASRFEQLMREQKKIAAFNAYVKKNAIATVGISKAEQTAHEEAAPPPPMELPPMESEQEMEVSYHISDPLADL